MRAYVRVVGTHLKCSREQLTIRGAVPLYTDLAANIGEGAAERFRFCWTSASQTCSRSNLTGNVTHAVGTIVSITEWRMPPFAAAETIHVRRYRTCQMRCTPWRKSCPRHFLFCPLLL